MTADPTSPAPRPTPAAPQPKGERLSEGELKRVFDSLQMPHFVSPGLAKLKAHIGAVGADNAKLARELADTKQRLAALAEPKDGERLVLFLRSGVSNILFGDSILGFDERWIEFTKDFARHVRAESADQIAKLTAALSALQSRHDGLRRACEEVSLAYQDLPNKYCLSNCKKCAAILGMRAALAEQPAPAGEQESSPRKDEAPRARSPRNEPDSAPPEQPAFVCPECRGAECVQSGDDPASVFCDADDCEWFGRWPEVEAAKGKGKTAEKDLSEIAEAFDSVAPERFENVWMALTDAQRLEEMTKHRDCIVTHLESTGQDLAATRAALKDLTERAERARGILKDSPSNIDPKWRNWGMLDTKRAREVLDTQPQHPAIDPLRATGEKDSEKPGATT